MSCRDNIYFSDYISIPILKMEFTYLIYIFNLHISKCEFKSHWLKLVVLVLLLPGFKI